MKIIFFGSSNFAVLPLEALLGTSHDVSCVVTQPDKLKGRGLNLLGTAVKEAALKRSIKVYQPRDVNAADSLEFLKGLNPDLFVVIAYGQILSRKILDIPRVLPINIHASALPKYRGAAPINWAIINGEKTTGITVIKMTREMDAGPVILKREIEITDDDTSLTLEEKLSKLAGQMLLTAISFIDAGDYDLKPQDPDAVTLAPKLKKEDGRIDWNKPAGEVYNLIRGCLGWPGAFTYYNGKMLKILKARICPDTCLSTSSKAAQIVNISKDGITVAAGNGALVIEELQPEGKRRMKSEEFAAGHKVSNGDFFGR